MLFSRYTEVMAIFLVLLVLSLGIEDLALASHLEPHDAYATFPGTNGKIAFFAFYGGGNFICDGENFFMNSDGSDPAVIPHSGGCGSAVSFSPDGTKVTFSRMEYDDESGLLIGSKIYMTNVDGTNFTALTNDTRYSAASYSPSFSPDGKKIVFSSRMGSNTSQIYIMNSNGTGGFERLTNDTLDDDVPIFSPDGKNIVFVRAGNIFSMNADADGEGNRVVINLSNNHNNNATATIDKSPSFSPDGKKIAFVRDHSIYLMDADDGSYQTLLKKNAPFSPSWSPDGTKIAFSDGRDILVVDADGRNQRRILHNYDDVDDPPLVQYSQPSWGPTISSTSNNDDNGGGNTTTSAHIDKTLPMLRIISPMNGTTIRNGSPLDVLGTASDTGSGVHKIEVRIGPSDKFEKASGTLSWKYSVLPSSPALHLSQGIHNVTVRATDAVGNIASRSFMFVNVVNDNGNNNNNDHNPPPKSLTVLPITGNIVLKDRSSCFQLFRTTPEKAADATASKTSTTSSPAAATTAVIWNSTTATCVIAHGTIVVSKSGSITISSSVTLDIASSAIFQNNGTVNSVGMIKNNGEAKNFGTISSSGIIENRGLVENSGTLNNSNTIDNFGVIDNNNSAGHLVNSAYIIIHNNNDNSGGGGKILGSGTVINSGHILTR
jgi:hypothetical protein